MNYNLILYLTFVFENNKKKYNLTEINWKLCILTHFYYNLNM